MEKDARVEEFDKICEVTSDKATVDVTSRFSGVIKKLHYQANDTAYVGKPLIDIDVDEDGESEDNVLDAPAPIEDSETASNAPDGFMANPSAKDDSPSAADEQEKKGSHASLATPAVRHLSKELKIDIKDVDGTGRDGRVTKEDLYKHQDMISSNQHTTQTSGTSATPRQSTGQQVEMPVPLTQNQAQMFKTMTRSLQIPHFVYSDEFDITPLVALRKRINNGASKSVTSQKLSYMPFIIKALSLSLQDYPLLNSRLDTTSSKPTIINRSQHNIGIAMDTPCGLIVPVIKDVANLSIKEIAAELRRLQSATSSSSLSPSDLTGGTITISNIGNIGGTYLSPVIVDSQVAIVGVGRIREIPGFDEEGKVVRRSVVNFSWSADHRVVDGAVVARCSEVLRGFLEGVEGMVLLMR